MATDNRITLNDASSTFTDGNDTGSVVTAAGLYYEGGQAVSVQFTNSDERSFTTNIGGTRDLSDSTCYLLVKDNLVETQTNGGIKYVLYDGTNEIGYEVGGNDNTGNPLATFFNSYKLDVSNSSAFTGHEFAGSEASLNKAAITGVGFGTYHLSKAVGAIDNCFMDRLSFHTNGSAALTIDAGTAGTPITLETIAADDIANGWGLVGNPQGSQFNVFGPVDFGDSSAGSSYFAEVDSQITLIGLGIGAGNFDFKTICNGTGTNLFQLDNCVVVNLGAVANWDFSDTNSNTLEIMNCQFVNGGTFAFPVTGGTSRKCDGSTFVNCGQVDPSTMVFTNNSFIGTTDATGALLGNKSIDGLSFTSDGTGHAIYITSTGTYTYTSNTFSGYGSTASTDAVVYNNSGGAVTINVSSGATPTYRNGAGATTTIVAGAVTVAAKAVTAAGVAIQGARVILLASDGSGAFPFEESVTITRASTTATVSHSAHGMTNNDKIAIDGADQDEYNGVKTITFIDSNSYSFTVSGSPTTPATGTLTGTFVAISGITDSFGEVGTTRVYGTNQPVTGWTRKSTSAPFYQQGILTGTISTTTGFSATAVMIADE